MSGAGKYKFYEWDEATFVLPEEYILYNNSDLADALNVFYLVGGYDFFLIADSKQMNYSDKWLDKMIKSYNNTVIPSGEL